MADKAALFPIVRDEIHFDVLFQRALDVITDLSGEYWTDHGEHDPGITLMQAMAYNISDLSYRMSLPLQDLLTPSPDKQNQEGIFPASFGPERVLTVNPITPNDYRRALMDIYVENTDHNYTGFVVRDALLLRQTGTADITYYYNKENRYFTFLDESSETIIKKEIGGSYQLLVEYLRDAMYWENGYKADKKVNDTINTWLVNNRNLCEKVTQLKLSGPSSDSSIENSYLKVRVFNPKLTVELNDDVSDINQIVKQIYFTVINYANPFPIRNTAQELLEQGYSIEDIFNGPYMENGWIMQLPPVVDYTQARDLDLSPAAKDILEIPGVKNIISFTETQLHADANEIWLVWSPDVFKQSLKLIKRGQSFEIPADSYQYPNTKKTSDSYNLEYGQYRDRSSYYPITNYIPPTYGLQLIEPNQQEIRLHQFLLPFEQTMANICNELSVLPDLLSFNLNDNLPIWSWQWPFAEGSVSDKVHQQYKQQIIDFLGKNEEDNSNLLNLIDYLLGYFGRERGNRVIPTDENTFLVLQRAYLAQQGELGYYRTNIRSDQVAAVQKRIALRLGIGLELFNANADLGNLSFYLVENRGLLPVFPSTSFYLAVTAGKEIDGSLLEFSYTSDSEVNIQANMLISLVIQDKLEITGIPVVAIPATNTFRVRLADNILLEKYKNEILTAATDKKLNIVPTHQWLNEMAYLAVYASDQSGMDSKQKRFTVTTQSPFPTVAKPGDKIIFGLFGPLGQAIPADAIHGEVVNVDPIAGTYVLKSDSDFPAEGQLNGYHWMLEDGPPEMFSFTVSLVFRRNIFDGIADPYAMEAWIKQVISEELPAHIGFYIYYFTDDQFRNFAQAYKRWNLLDGNLSTDAYQILFQLGLGIQPQFELGTGLLKIATPEQRQTAIGTSGDQWNEEYIRSNQLLYVPEDNKQS